MATTLRTGPTAQLLFMSNDCTNVYRWFIKAVHNI
ncbi:hypothetical protein J3D46_004344 [Paenarthrobacter sp. A20]|nr:hypothetical protein [Paenarthrobacter sp. A20]